VLEVDFIGKKFIRGRSQPINFIAFSLRFPRKLKCFQRIAAESADEVIDHCQDFFRRFEKPQVVKIDNGFAFAGSSSWPRTLSKVIIFLLKEQVMPVFTAPRKPWNQASVEGANSIFARKFWRRFQFTSLEEIDEKLEVSTAPIKIIWAIHRRKHHHREARLSPSCTSFVKSTSSPTPEALTSKWPRNRFSCH